MKAQIKQYSMGYRVRLAGPGFDVLLDTFKSIIPKKCRRFIAEHSYWFIDLRAKRKVKRFIESVTLAGGEVLKG